MMKAVGIGTLSLDVIRHPGGEMQRAGGSCANILMHLADMGWDCTMCHMSGNDVMAERVRDDLNARGVKSVTMKTDVPTFVLVINSNNGHSFSRVCDHGNKMSGRISVDESLLGRLDSSCDAFVFDRVEPSAVKFAAECEGLRWLETHKCSMQSPLWNRCVGAADIIKTADDASIPDHKAQMHTRGADGLEYSGPQGRITMPSITPPRFADACGCGDCVSACCIDSLCSGGTVKEGLLRGTRLAALNCCYPGPWCMMDSTTRQYRQDVMDGEPIKDAPRLVFKGGSFKLCACGV